MHHRPSEGEHRTWTTTRNRWAGTGFPPVNSMHAVRAHSVRQYRPARRVSELPRYSGHRTVFDLPGHLAHTHTPGPSHPVCRRPAGGGGPQDEAADPAARRTHTEPAVTGRTPSCHGKPVRLMGGPHCADPSAPVIGAGSPGSTGNRRFLRRTPRMNLPPGPSSPGHRRRTERAPWSESVTDTPLPFVPQPVMRSAFVAAGFPDSAPPHAKPWSQRGAAGRTRSATVEPPPPGIGGVRTGSRAGRHSRGGRKSFCDQERCHRPGGGKATVRRYATE